MGGKCILNGFRSNRALKLPPERVAMLFNAHPARGFVINVGTVASAEENSKAISEKSLQKFVIKAIIGFAIRVEGLRAGEV